jgi:hypothetical protein
MLLPKRDEETGGWRKLHNEELHNLYSSASRIRMIVSWTDLAEDRNQWRAIVNTMNLQTP